MLSVAFDFYLIDIRNILKASKQLGNIWKDFPRRPKYFPHIFHATKIFSTTNIFSTPPKYQWNVSHTVQIVSTYLPHLKNIWNDFPHRPHISHIFSTPPNNYGGVGNILVVWKTYGKYMDGVGIFPNIYKSFQLYANLWFCIWIVIFFGESVLLGLVQIVFHCAWRFVSGELGSNFTM